MLSTTSLCHLLLAYKISLLTVSLQKLNTLQTLYVVGTSVWSSFDDPEVIHIHVPVDIPQPENGDHELRVHSSTLYLYRMASRPENIVDTRTVNLQVRSLSEFTFCFTCGLIVMCAFVS